MEKRGAGHIEFVTSIVLFIIVVGGAVYFLSPTKSARTIESSLEYTFNEIRDYSNVEIKIISVKIIPSELTSGIVSVPIDIGDDSVRVEKQNGDKIISGRGSNKACFYYAESAYDGGYFATIKTGKELISINEITTCPDVIDGTYTPSSFAERKFISEAKMIELKSRYEEGYLGLKEEFNLPGNEFAFSLVFLDNLENIDALKNIPSGLEVFSNSKRVEVLKEDGSSEFAELVVLVW